MHELEVQSVTSDERTMFQNFVKQIQYIRSSIC